MASAYNKEALQALLQMLQGGGLEQSPLYQSGGSYLQNLLSGSPEAFANFEAPFMQQFQQETVPQLVEQFAGLGTGGGALSSSALNNSLAQAARSLSTDLAGMRSNLQMQALPQALQYAQQPLQNIFSATQQIPGQYKPKQPKQSSFLGPLGGLLGGALGFFGGGPAGTALGYNTGSGLGNAF